MSSISFIIVIVKVEQNENEEEELVKNLKDKFQMYQSQSTEGKCD